MNFNRVFALVALLSASIFVPRVSLAQTDFGQRIWWKSDHNSFSAEVNRVIGIPSATYPAAGTPNVNGAHFTNAPGQWPVSNQKTNLPFPGKSAPIDVVAKVKPASVGAAFGRLAQKVGPVANVLALATFAAEVGFIITDGPDGSRVIQKQTSPPAGYDGYEWSLQSGSPWQETRQALCSWYAVQRGISGPPYNPNHWKCINANSYSVGNTFYMQVGLTAGGSVMDVLISRRTDPTPFVPSTESATAQELADKIANESGWPSNSHIREAIVEAIKNGETIDYDPAQVSGPATRPGSSSTTTAPDGTVTTVTVTHYYTYNGPKVTVTTTTTTTTTAPGGSPVTSTKTDTDPAPDADPEEAGIPTDTPLPGQPSLYEPKYPDGLVGVWNAKKAQLDSTPLLNLLDDLMPDVAASGSCPSWIISMDLHAWNFGAHDVSPPCWLWDFAKVVIIASALLLARRLVFGG